MAGTSLGWRWLNKSQAAELRAMDQDITNKSWAAEQAATQHGTQQGGIFVDPEFPRDIASIDGKGAANRRGEAEPDNEEPPEPVAPSCSCTPPAAAKLITVTKENNNQGRQFWGCSTWSVKEGSKCKFFKWADDDKTHTKMDLKLTWERMPSDFCLVGPSGYKAAHIRQGSLGDCWFMAALAVVAERGDHLLKRNVLTRAVDKHGHYLFRLFIDGHWQLYSVDDYLPVHPGKPNKRDLPGMPPLAYSKATEKQLWVPLLEKAYAKAHGSYKAIHGGWIAEALWDLTGFPTESISFNAQFFDSETTWARLLSFREQNFLLGLICKQSADGLVGNHAYSLLDVRELTDVTVGEQKSMRDYFDPISGKNVPDPFFDYLTPGRQQAAGIVSEEARASKELPPGMTAEGTLRLVRVRNPWGQMEWTGAFSAGSVQWTNKTRALLGQTDTNDGTFWMSWHDCMSRFNSLDICKTHEGWFAESRELVIEPGRWCAAESCEIRVSEPTWLYASICQPNKRGKAHRRYYYSDICLLVLRSPNDGNAEGPPVVQSVEIMRLSGECRLSHQELMLDDPKCIYTFVAFSVSRATAARTPSKPFKESTKDERTFAANLQKAAPFTLRVQSGKPVEVRGTTRVDQTAAAAAMHTALADMRLPGVRATVVQLDPDAQLVIREGAGAAMALVVNRSRSRTLRVRMLLHGAAAGSCSAGDVWHTVPPNAQMVVEAIKALDNEDYQSAGSQTSFALDAVEVERPGGVTGDGGAASGAASPCALFAPQRITVGSGVVATAPLPRSGDALGADDPQLQRALEESLLTHGGGKQPEGGEDHALVAALAASLTTSSSSQQQHAAGEYGGGGAVSHKRKAEELDPELAAAIALSLAGRGQGSGSAPIVVLDDSQDSEVIVLLSSQEG